MGEPEPSVVDEHLTAEQHILKADAALTAAKAAHGKYIAEYERRADGATLRLAEYLDLIQMVNTHANMASAKSLIRMEACGRFHPGESCRLGINHPEGVAHA